MNINNSTTPVRPSYTTSFTSPSNKDTTKSGTSDFSPFTNDFSPIIEGRDLKKFSGIIHEQDFDVFINTILEDELEGSRALKDGLNNYKNAVGCLKDEQGNSSTCILITGNKVLVPSNNLSSFKLGAWSVQFGHIKVFSERSEGDIYSIDTTKKVEEVAGFSILPLQESPQITQGYLNLEDWNCYANEDTESVLVHYPKQSSLKVSVNSFSDAGNLLETNHSIMEHSAGGIHLNHFGNVIAVQLSDHQAVKISSIIEALSKKSWNNNEYKKNRQGSSLSNGISSVGQSALGGRSSSCNTTMSSATSGFQRFDNGKRSRNYTPTTPTHPQKKTNKEDRPSSGSSMNSESSSSMRATPFSGYTPFSPYGNRQTFSNELAKHQGELGEFSEERKIPDQGNYVVRERWGQIPGLIIDTTQRKHYRAWFTQYSGRSGSVFPRDFTPSDIVQIAEAIGSQEFFKAFPKDKNTPPQQKFSIKDLAEDLPRDLLDKLKQAKIKEIAVQAGFQNGSWEIHFFPKDPIS